MPFTVASRPQRPPYNSPVPAPRLPVPILSAPTAAGKSALALQAARQAGSPVELVSADAFTVYRGLDIGTAKPGPADLAAAPHHLIDVVDVESEYDVARFTRDAEAALADILERGHRPLVVGGTGFYLQALMHGLPLTPPADPAVRETVAAEMAGRGWEALLADIEARDPAEAERMQRNPRRIARATEVHRMTGRYPGAFGRSAPAFTYDLIAFTLEPDALARRQAGRIAAMLDAGWPAEARWLASRVAPDLQPRPTVWQALGYRDVLDLALGRRSREAVQEAVALATRQYTKRQLTFLRTQLGAALLGPADAGDRLGARLTANR